MSFYYVASQGILGIRTNIKGFKWCFGSDMPESTEDEYLNCAVKIHVVLENFNDDEKLASMGRYHYFNGSPGGNEVHYTRKLPMNQKMRFKAENLLSEEAKITVNKTYFKFITHRIMNLHSIHYIVTDLAALLLLKKGFAPIHCSAFQKEDKTVAVFAPPDTGKTLSAVTACMDFGAKFIAEDMAITDGKTIYAVPWTNSFCHYTENSKKDKSRDPKAETAQDKKRQAVLSAEVTHVAVLEKDQDGTALLPESIAIAKLMNLNRYEFNYLRSPLLTAYEFFNPGLMIDEGLIKEREILTALVNNSQKAFTLKRENPTHYAEALLFEMDVNKTPVSVQ
ncbi:hypothetical protein B0H99_102247 [Planomicrobium soli]|uniref:Hpr(Ser) kinase/phosphatase n=1 Tax=Planomicrobium soli TaxID=1176648 RepID=A0A2P8H5S7_9BACL|nr:hypothetical protein [Planomicrobium soli]PSL41563.1 hypothetical protein B0H99_102247 [Planomicrobium soli]